MTDGTLFTGKSVEDALADGLRSLGLTQEQVEVEIISRGSRGLFGIGSEPAQVRLTPRSASRPSEPPAAPAPVASAPVGPAQPAVESAPRPVVAASAEPAAAAERKAAPAPEPVAAREAGADEDLVPPAYGAEDSETPAAGSRGTTAELDADLAPLAVELLSETVRLMGFEDAEVVATWEEPDADNDEPYLLLNVDGRELGALIGRRGETLNNLQYLLRLMVNQRLHEWKNIVVDVQQYRQHRAEHLTQLALRSAEQVARSGRPLSLEPMPSNERRIIHLALRDSATVYTESSGDGERRKVQILPKRS